MKWIRKCYKILSIICIVAFILNLDLNLNLQWKWLICFVITLSAVFFYLVDMGIKEAISITIDSTIDICSSQLPHEQTQQLMRFFIHECSSWQSISGFIDKTVSYIEKNNSIAHQKIISDALMAALSNWGTNCKTYKANCSKIVLRVSQALNMESESIIRRYIRASLSLDNSDKPSLLLIFDYILFIPPISLLYANLIFSSFLDYKDLFILLVYVCAGGFILIRKKRYNLFMMLAYWIIHFLCTVALPALQATDDFLNDENFIFFHLNFIVLLILGIQLINRLWTQTAIEKNKGAFISDRKLLEVIDSKWQIMCRTPLLWCSFFMTVLGTIIMYSFIFINHLNCGSPRYCLLLSISIYFSGSFKIVESIDGFYFTSEIIFSFLLNTLYIANIVRLILEPKLGKE